MYHDHMASRTDRVCCVMCVRIYPLEKKTTDGYIKFLKETTYFSFLEILNIRCFILLLHGEFAF